MEGGVARQKKRAQNNSFEKKTDTLCEIRSTESYTPNYEKKYKTKLYAQPPEPGRVMLPDRDSAKKKVFSEVPVLVQDREVLANAFDIRRPKLDFLLGNFYKTQMVRFNLRQFDRSKPGWAAQLNRLKRNSTD